MPTLQQVKDTIDTYISTFWPNYQSNQAVFPESRFFQGLSLFPSGVPLFSASVDGSKKPEAFEGKPSDRDVSWQDFNVPGLNKNTILPCDIIGDEYLGPGGKGYTVQLLFRYDDSIDIKLWCKTLQDGPEVWREHNWLSLEDD